MKNGSKSKSSKHPQSLRVNCSPSRRLSLEKIGLSLFDPLLFYFESLKAYYSRLSSRFDPQDLILMRTVVFWVE
ncbi:hypothetical protein LWI29_013575 [Acer saccharum]|uniref:Uncharacterized protein n=1 Tax=Acer saccharum TaxID=4024 RepID=A0AA39VKR4_ACESA|nr:hypothetical protein LWI29_013575 [Acer saccharum]